MQIDRFNLDAVKGLFDKYAASLSDDDNDKDERYGTPRAVWKAEINAFIEWLTSDNPR